MTAEKKAKVTADAATPSLDQARAVARALGGKPAAAPQPAAVSAAPAEAAEPKDEIDDIMSEIENLQKSMAEAPLASAGTRAAPAASIAPVVPLNPVQPEADELDALAGMEDFRGSGDDASLEETLGSMKDESEGSGHSLLDVPVEEEVSEEVQEGDPEEDAIAKILAAGDEIEGEESSEMVAAPAAEAEVEEGATEEFAGDVADDADIADEGEDDSDAVAEAPVDEEALIDEVNEVLSEIQEEPALPPKKMNFENSGDLDASAPVLAATGAARSGQMLSNEVPVMAKDEKNTADGSLTMVLAGNMTLNLKYECEGMEVSIGFSDNALCVQLKDGTEFKIPVARAKRLKAVG